MQQVEHRTVPSTVEIAWSADGQSAVLLINDYPHAVFNFQAKAGYCRTGLPPTSVGSSWSKSGHAWTDEALRPFSNREP